MTDLKPFNHGVPGVLKNALDWLVDGSEFVGKPIALLNASPRATYALASLTEIVTVMSGRLIPEASITLPLLGRHLDAHGIVADPELSLQLQTARCFADTVRVAAFAKAVASQFPKDNRLTSSQD